MHALSGITGEGVEALDAVPPPGRTIALLGSSGVGKSTLVNRLAGREVLATQEVRADGRGRHTTSHRELVPLPGGALLLDTPGMRELQLWEIADGLAGAFADVEEIEARVPLLRLRDTTASPAARSAPHSPTARSTAERWESYSKLQRELHCARGAPERAARRRGAQEAARGSPAACGR